MSISELLDIKEYVGSDQGWRRDAVYATLHATFKAEIDTVCHKILSRDLVFSEMNALNKLQVRRHLIERHCLPFLLTHHAFFPGVEPKLDVLTACISAHTLALTHLDYHLDGALPATGNEVSAVKMPAPSAVSYAVRMVYEAGTLVDSPDDLKELFHDVIQPISGFVVSRMHEDWLVRTTGTIDSGCSSIEEYLNSSTSRLLTSGYWEVMIRAAFIGRSKEFPEELQVFCSSLRKLRQLIDELYDIEEDLTAGLITLPALIAFNIKPEIRHDIEHLRTGELSAREKNQLLSFLRSENVVASCNSYVMKFYESGKLSIKSILDERRRLLELLLELKLAKYDALRRESFQ